MTTTHAFCPACGTPATSSGAFCSGCGVSLLKPDDSAPSQKDSVSSVHIPSPNSQVSADTPSGQPPRKAIRRPFVVLGIGVVAFFVIGGISAAFFGSSGSHTQGASSNGTAVHTSTSAGNSGTTQATAPPGSTKSYADGYMWTLDECIPPNGVGHITSPDEGCGLVPPYSAMPGLTAKDEGHILAQPAAGIAAKDYCNWADIQGYAKLGDNPNEWTDGCEAVAVDGIW